MTRNRLILLALLVVSLSAIVVSLLIYQSPGQRRLSSELWRSYKTKFITADGRVIDRDGGKGEITHTEGQGYGMLLAEAAGDRDSFDLLWHWTSHHLRRSDGLFSWRWQDGRVTDQNNASDGDILIAWALLRAGRHWRCPDCKADARAIAAALLDRQTVKRGHLLLLLPGVEGFQNADGVVVNPSYWIFPAFRDFAASFHQPAWSNVAESGLELLRDARYGQWNLPPDWLRIDGDGMKPADGFPPQYGFNAVRIPLYVVWSGGGHGVDDILAPFRLFWCGDHKNGVPAWVDLTNGAESPYGWQTGMAAVAALALDQKDTLPAPKDEDGYYSWSLALLSQIAQKEIAP